MMMRGIPSAPLVIFIASMVAATLDATGTEAMIGAGAACVTAAATGTLMSCAYTTMKWGGC